MRAVVIHETGGPEVLSIEEIPAPEAREGEVLIRVEAVGVNRFDVNQRAGGASSFPLVLSSFGDAAGVRDDTDERVLATSTSGTYAELVAAREENVSPLPSGVEPTVAAALPTPYRVAWWGLVGVGELRQGETLLVQGGASSTGQAAIDIGKSLGARVYATASQQQHGRLEELGAEALAYEDPKLTELGASVVFDPLGARTFERSLEAAAREGRIVTPGAVGDPKVTFNIGTLVAKRLRVEGIAGQAAPPETVGRLLEMVASGELHPWVEKELPLERAAEAHRLIESGEIVGRVVLVP
jgi:NADPH:quinone reductase-like Zn-dependent oxidoreductase